MKISECGRITIPKRFRDQYGLDPGVEIDLVPTDDGLLIRKGVNVEHPVECVSGILDGIEDAVFPVESVGKYIDEIRAT